MSEVLNQIVERLADLIRRVHTLEAQERAAWTWLTTPLTSASWDGDAKSNGDSATLDLSAVFGVPAGVRAILVAILARDSGSSGGAYGVIVKPAVGASDRCLEVRLDSAVNDAWRGGMAWVPCDANGDVYVGITASGAGTLDLYLTIWGYAQ